MILDPLATTWTFLGGLEVAAKKICNILAMCIIIFKNLAGEVIYYTIISQVCIACNDTNFK